MFPGELKIEDYHEEAPSFHFITGRDLVAEDDHHNLIQDDEYI